MSRRKQAKPQHLKSEEEETQTGLCERGRWRRLSSAAAGGAPGSVGTVSPRGLEERVWKVFRYQKEDKSDLK